MGFGMVTSLVGLVILSTSGGDRFISRGMVGSARGSVSYVILFQVSILYFPLDMGETWEYSNNVVYLGIGSEALW